MFSWLTHSSNAASHHQRFRYVQIISHVYAVLLLQFDRTADSRTRLTGHHRYCCCCCCCSDSGAHTAPYVRPRLSFRVPTRIPLPATHSSGLPPYGCTSKLQTTEPVSQLAGWPVGVAALAPATPLWLPTTGKSNGNA